MPEEEECCFICLEAPGACAPSSAVQELLSPCKCPRKVHQHCLARWQLQSAGRKEERQCRFCRAELPDWRAVFGTPASPSAAAGADPIMSITHAGSTYWLQVKLGEGGVEAFKDDVRRLLGLSEEQAFDITFECRLPSAAGDGSKLELRGLDAYDAAVYCASLTAAERLTRATAADLAWPDKASWESGSGSGSSLWPRSRASSSGAGSELAAAPGVGLMLAPSSASSSSGSLAGLSSSPSFGSVPQPGMAVARVPSASSMDEASSEPSSEADAGPSGLPGKLMAALRRLVSG